MRTFITFVTLTTLTVALAGAPASGKAPVPKEEPQPTIDGKYTLLSVSLPEDRAMGLNPGGVIGGGGPGGLQGGRVRTSTTAAYMAGPAVITKNKITLEGRGVISPLAGLNSGPTTMEYTLDASKSPMTIDVRAIDLRGKKTSQLGLAEVASDRLVIAVAAAGEDRPKNTEENGNVTVYYFKMTPQPKTEFRIVAMTVGKEALAEKELNKLAGEGFELTSTTTPSAPDAKSSVTTVHFVLKRVTK